MQAASPCEGLVDIISYFIQNPLGLLWLVYPLKEKNTTTPKAFEFSIKEASCWKHQIMHYSWASLGIHNNWFLNETFLRYTASKPII